ncbi:hypothetical protein WI61_15845 [Burkholderia cepacia]|nr:hypothetical protein WI49_33215 [Burkholderia cepacia]KVA79217.1 hypothetical protein WI50_27990 [Burkholderia cepacia]KVA83203.1 hypothetical protein WI52_16830 [Burkholderia cepacia]KVB00658.1 hypothetical protein WI54_29625 [Burkholderia cepacia]KVB04945.1 hypothetical protein WI55_22990 [Burkholderia cepacia]
MNDSLLRIALRYAARTPRRRIRLDSILPQFLRKALAPSLQILVPWIQAAPVRATYLDAQMNMRMRFVFVRGENVRTPVAELKCREITRRIAHGFSIRSGRHRQQDIESFTPRTGLRDSPAAQLPGLHEIAQRILAFNAVAVLIFQFDSAVTGYIAQMPTYRAHALRTPRLVGDLDHDLRGTPERAGDPSAHEGSGIANIHM